MRSSDYLMHCFGYMEMLLQVNLTDYLNPMSAQIKLWQLRSDLWQDWYVFIEIFSSPMKH
uniref:Uncharacterized protein n=1 Tax=Parascaris equorum TaxID=6256 RepID=A0A914RZG5_PAREQ